VARFTRSTARGARAIFRALLAAQLILYMFIITVPIAVVVGIIVGIVTLVLGITSGDGLSGLFDGDGTGLLVVLGICIVIGIGWAMKQQYGLLLQLVGVRELDLQQRGVSGLVRRVAGLAMGPADQQSKREHTDRTWTISQADEARVLARVRRRGGRLRAGDLVSWLGLGLDAAEAQATRLCVEYGGEAAPLTDDASVQVLEFRFSRLLQTTGATGYALDREPTRFERSDPPVPFTGNQGRHDLMVVIFALLNLGAGLVGWHFLGASRHRGALLWLAWLGGALLPVSFSCLLLALPVLRSPLFVIQRVRVLVRRARELMVKALLARATAAVDLEALAASFPLDPQLPRPSPAELRQVALELGGAFELDDPQHPSKTVWVFPRLRAELAGSAPVLPLETVKAGTREGDGSDELLDKQARKAARKAELAATRAVRVEKQQLTRRARTEHRAADTVARELRVQAERERRARPGASVSASRPKSG
jgi:hypothetical protein